MSEIYFAEVTTSVLEGVMEIELAIAKAPTKHVWDDGFWRNRHNDMTSWHRRINQAVLRAGILGRWDIVGVRIDWGRGGAFVTERQREQFANALELGLRHAGIETGPAGWPLTEEAHTQSPDGVWVSLRHVGVG